MSTSADEGAGTEDFPASTGSSTDQHITGSPETGTFITDKAPAGDTPAHGSSNAGINATGANRPGHSDDAGESDPSDRPGQPEI
jgi:hypothetical protein